MYNSWFILIILITVHITSWWFQYQWRQILAVTWSLTPFAFLSLSLPRPRHSNNHASPVISASTITLSYHHTLSNLLHSIPAAPKSFDCTVTSTNLALVSCLTGEIEGSRRQFSHSLPTTSTLYISGLYPDTISLYPALSSQYEWHTSVFMSRTYLCTFTPEPILSSLCKDLKFHKHPFISSGTNIFLLATELVCNSSYPKNSLLCMPHIPAVATLFFAPAFSKTLIQRDVYCLCISVLSESASIRAYLISTSWNVSC